MFPSTMEPNLGVGNFFSFFHFSYFYVNGIDPSLLCLYTRQSATHQMRDNHNVNASIVITATTTTTLLMTLGIVVAAIIVPLVMGQGNNTTTTIKEWPNIMPNVKNLLFQILPLLK